MERYWVRTKGMLDSAQPVEGVVSLFTEKEKSDDAYYREFRE